MAFNRKQRLRDNIEAIRTAFLLDREQRTPTARERLLLERYCGFGGLKSILNPARELTDAVHWAKSDLELFAPTVELHKLLRENTKDDTEYKRYMDAMKQSVLTAFYTPPEITGTIADVLHEHGIRPDRVLEPSAGVGAFVDSVLENRPDADIMAFEKDLMTGKILKHLHPGQKVRVQGFEKIEKPFMNHFDLAISNIPFGDVAVFDPDFSGSKDPARHSAARTIHNYFFLKSLDAVREGGIVAFITSQGVLDAPTNAPIREYMMNHANLVGVARLPNNLFTDNAGTEVGSDLIILQKNSGKNGELYYNEKLFVQTEQTPIGTSVNGYVWSIGSLSHTDLIRSTDPYGKPAYKLLHRGDIAQLAEDLREHLKIELQQLDRKLYERHRLHPTKEESTAAEVQPAPKTEKVSPSVIAPVSVIEPVKGVEKPQAQPIEEKPEIEPRQPNHSSAVQLTLLDLWGMPIEEPLKKKKAAKKESKPKPMPSTPKPQVKVTPPVEAAKPVNGNKEEKPENAEKPNDPDDIYATLDWETNPPINGFYETMMSLTAERRKALRLEAERHRQEQLKKMGIKDTLNPAFAPSSDNMDKKPEQTEEIKQPETLAEVVPTSETVATSLFPELETEKPKEKVMDLSPRPFNGLLEPHHRDGSMVLDASRNLGYLKDLTPYGATFQPLDLRGYQKEKAMLYISLRDAYERLYSHETENHTEHKPQRGYLNTYYDEFVMRYGNLNARQNVKLVMMDAGGRDILSLERAEDGKFVKADIFDRPVSFSVESRVNAGSPEEALSASLNKFGTVNLGYMREITDTTEEELLGALKGRIFYNPLVTGYEIKDRFIAGNVIEKAERIEGWMEDNPESERMPEVKQAWEALKEAEPQRIAFEDLDFNFGERWIPTGVYAAYMSHLFDTDVKIAYSASMDEFSVACGYRTMKITDEFLVKGYYRNYDGMHLLKHALHNTCPDMMKSIGKDENGNDIKVRDSEGIQLANAKIDEIRNGFSEWLEEQSPQFKERLTTMYNRKFNCFVRPKYDGSHLTFPGLDRKALGIEDLYPSQKDAIWMDILLGGGIVDHEVGGGKTLIMCCGTYEKKRIGLVNKPMITGLKANIHEIAKTFCTAYPMARVLYPGREDFTPKKREQIFRQIKNNDWDAVILSHEQFGMIPQSPEIQQEILRAELDSVMQNLMLLKAQGKNVSKRMLTGCIKRQHNLEAKLQKAQYALDHRRDDAVDFRRMGIDHLYVDESHKFKNLMFNTRHSRVSGLGNTDGSKKATNLLYAIRTIQQRTGRDLGATFLSGTTIANSLTELYLLFKYLRPKELERQDIPCFDAWTAVFAQKTSEFEFSVTNEVISKERFRYFIKVPELAMFYNEITDYRTAADVGIDRPELDEELCQIPMTDDQQAFLDKLVLFAKTGDPEHIGRADLSDGEVKALMLLVTMYSNKLSLDMRLISPAYADSPGNKASRSAANIAEYYRRYEDQKGTQMVFCDLSTYKPGIWNVYSEIKRKLVEDHGIPAQEIRFVQEAASDKVRQAMFDAMNEGKIRVLFGSTQKLGTGVNAQKRIVCMHHLDIPWRPMDLEQRNGRGARKGNIVAKEYAGNKVKAYVYAVLRTLDAYKLNLLHNKQQFIDQLKRNRLGARRLDEGAISEDSGMNFAEWMAVVSGNTDLLQKAKLEGRIAALESEQTIFMRTRHEAQSQLQRYTAEIGRRDAMLERLKRDWDYINEVAPPDAKGKRANPLRIDGVESTDIVAHGKRLVEIDRTVNTGDDYQKIGTLFDFRILVRTERMQKDGLALTVNKFMVEGLDGIKYTFNNGHLAAEPKTAATNFIRALDTIPSLMATYEKEKKQFTRDIPTFEQQIAAVWPKEEELKRLKAEAESLTRKIQLDIAQKQQEMQAKTADNGNGLKIENAEVVDEVIKPSKAEPLSAASGNQEEPPEEREHVVPPPESDFIRNHILLVRPATNVKAKGPKL